MPRAPRLLAAAVAVGLVVTACGDDDDDAADTTPVTTESVETTQVESTVAETVPEETTAPVETTPETTDAATTTTEAAAQLGSVLDVIDEAGTYTILLAAIDAAGLTEELSTREVTLLAPNDAAFQALGQDAIDALLADPATLTTVLQGHVLAVPQDTAAISIFKNVLAINGASWDVLVVDGTLTIGGAMVVDSDLEADNGIVQGLDAVLVPAPAEG